MPEVISKIFGAYKIFGGLIGELVASVIAVLGTLASVGVMVMVLIAIVGISGELIRGIVQR